MADPPYTLRPYQASDLAFHIGAKKSLNLSDPGTGKTGVVCVLAYYHWTRHGRKTIWAMPKSLMEKNKDEFGLFTEFEPEDIAILESDFAPLTRNWTGPTFTRQKRVRSMRIRLASGEVTNTHHYDGPGQLVYPSPLKNEQGPGWWTVGKAAPSRELPKEPALCFPVLGPDGKPKYDIFFEDEEAKDLIAAASDAKVFICTFSFLRSHWERLLDTIPEIDLFLVDELHMGYSTADSQQTDSFFFVTDRCSQFCGMTGTLIDGRLDSAFPAIHAIEPRYYGSKQGFLDEHALKYDDFDRVELWHNFEKIQAILARHSVRHTFEEVYGDEPVHFETKVVEMGPQCREKYDEFHEQAMLELDDMRVLDGTLPGVNLIRAQQIMAHPETMGLAKGEVTGKDKLLAAYATEGRPMLVFAQLQPEQERCVKVLEEQGLRVGLINANVSAKERARIDAAFCAGELDAIVGSGPTVAVGFNWERADIVVFISIDYKDTNILQAYRRGSRGNRTTTLRVIFVQYKNSVDQRKYQIVKIKSETANKVDPTRRILQVA
ncbi:DEAD/DEAH box helicase family protein [Sphingopyxis indica]|uniref:DEAD/DEAH box helicase family protein n=1 Tax=Sphingopyxis indica TaxID=436663 RepID=UPI002938DE61|nr:DEAD/DEAH box helicase family protein [Sphingopyxis indica]WOF44280.1 DEAD/DEAH box helicase family protein [Sphingopyxis indica]